MLTDLSVLLILVLFVAVLVRWVPDAWWLFLCFGFVLGRSSRDV